MRTVVFEGNTPTLIRQLPDNARLRAGYEIDRAQRDKLPENWKPFPSVGQGVREVYLKRKHKKHAYLILKLQKND